MKVKMIETRDGAEHGVHVRTFHAGNEYEIEDELAMSFIRRGKAEVPEVKPQERKAEVELTPAPRRKRSRRKSARKVDTEEE